MKRKGICGGIAFTLLATTLTGCGSGVNLASIPLVPALSQQEVIDYYKEALEYDTIATRTVVPNQVSYEMTEVTGSAKELATNEALKIEALLGKHTLSDADGLDENIHQYIKYVIDDKVLTRKGIVGVNEALGFYFVDIEYSLSPKSVGAFNQNIKYLGINGVFREDYGDGSIVIDTQFMEKATNDVNKYLVENPDYVTHKSPVAGVRAPLLDVKLYNTAAGMSLTETAVMPNLDLVYQYPAESGSISGYCLFPQGSFTLRDFGYSRSSMDGTATLRYVFKKDIMDPTKIEFTNVYVTNYELTNGLEIDDGAVAPDFMMTEAEKIIERSDRAICNNDITALMSGEIYDDIGVAVLYSNMRNYCYNQKHMTKAERIVGRTDHEYLIEFEKTIQEGPIGVGTSGTYVLDGYLVVQQEDTEFHITDYVVTKMEMTKEPQIDVESTILKRLAALNLTGEVTDEEKTGITELMNNLYTASTNRQLQGMYDCFNTDTNLLSSTHREYLNSQIRAWLLKKGTNSESTYLGVVSQWIGGADDQVEFFTNELIEYEGKDVGLYMQNYYLVSRFENKWVIDEMKVVESKDVSGAELRSIRESLESGKSITVEDADNKIKDEFDDTSDTQVESNKSVNENE